MASGREFGSRGQDIRKSGQRREVEGRREERWMERENEKQVTWRKWLGVNSVK